VSDTYLLVTVLICNLVNLWVCLRAVQRVDGRCSEIWEYLTRRGKVAAQRDGWVVRKKEVAP
jgi:hypothetical protein